MRSKSGFPLLGFATVSIIFSQLPALIVNTSNIPPVLGLGASLKAGGLVMQYEVVESQPYPGIWHVEGIDEEGRVFVTAFSGPEAEKRAREYAQWKNSSVHEM